MWLESPNACWRQRAPAWHLELACLHRVGAAITRDANAWPRGCVLSQDSKDPIAAHLGQSLAALERAVQDPQLRASAREIAATIIAALRSGNKLLIIGNGGSAADAQHIAAEIVGRYKRDRPANAAMALTTDTSALTAIANDYGFEQMFARQVAGLGQRGDVLLALSTSGRSPNILAALRTARERGLVTIGFTGRGEALATLCDHVLIAPSDDTPIIQQIHLTFAHGICDEIEQAIMGEVLRK
jgi:D-sedoheptulose 7-phosphate isomerase